MRTKVADAEKADDRLLICELQAGVNREENFRYLFESHAPAVAGFFKNRGLSNEECRDLTQETFLNAYRSILSFRSDSSFETWIFRIARNLLKNTLRNQYAKKRSAQVVPIDDWTEKETHPSDSNAAADLSSMGTGSGPLDHVLIDERKRLLRNAMAKLPAEQQQLVLFRVDHDLRMREISAIMKIPIGTVKSQLSRARNFLREELGQLYSGFDCLGEDR